MHTVKLVLNNEPLAKAETTVELDVLSYDGSVRGPLLEEIELEGKITLNPRGCRIFSLPSAAITPQATPATNGLAYNFYLVHIPFTLHLTAGNKYYQEVTLLVELANQDAIARDLLPKHSITQIEGARRYTCSPQMKFKEVTANQEPEGEIYFDNIQPVIHALGDGESKFYWVYTGDGKRGVVPETKHALFILQVPSGTPAVEGIIRYEVIIATRRLGGWKSRQCKVSSCPIRWELSAAPSFFDSTSPQLSAAGPAQTKVATPAIVTNKAALRYDVCVVCALPEETEAFLNETARACGVTFQPAISPRSGREHRYTTIANRKGEPLTLCVSWPPDYGSLETGIHLKSVLEEFQPRFAAMVGICAGDKRKVKLGDIVVAERAFFYDAGKVIFSDDGQREHLYDTNPYHPHPDVLHFARMSRTWEQELPGMTRPDSRRQQRDWLLCRLLETKDAHVESIPAGELAQFAPDWKRIVQDLQRGSPSYLTPDRTLRDRLAISQLHYGPESFPFKDPPAPALHIAPLASGNTVRADDPFDQIRIPVRGTVAIDMEGAAFYRTVADFHDLHALLVKGVSDYADSDKDDSYHAYAASAAAIYMLNFIKAYVIADRRLS